jgi:molecular chaperone DnaJ
MKRDYYEILNISKDADTGEIKKSYRRLAHMYHPDKNNNDPAAEDKFREAHEAYSILSDSQKRRKYDQFGHASVNSDQFSSSSININDIFGDIFGDIFSGQTREQVTPRIGNDINYSLNINFHESISGIVKTIIIPRREACSKCSGSGAQPGSKPSVCSGCYGRGEVSAMKGFFAITQTCPKCHGTGKYISNKCLSCHGEQLRTVNAPVKITIPAGIDNGMKIKVSEEGDSGLYGGSKGDLYVLIYITEHTIFKRQNCDILCDITIKFTQAILGCVAEVPTVNGAVEMKIPAGTQPNTIFRLKGKGASSLRKGHVKGDQLVRIQVEIPKLLDNTQLTKLTEFEKTCSNKNFPKYSDFLKKIGKTA